MLILLKVYSFSFKSNFLPQIFDLFEITYFCANIVLNILIHLFCIFSILKINICFIYRYSTVGYFIKEVTLISILKTCKNWSNDKSKKDGTMKDVISQRLNYRAKRGQFKCSSALCILWSVWRWWIPLDLDRLRRRLVVIRKIIVTTRVKIVRYSIHKVCVHYSFPFYSYAFSSLENITNTSN